MSSSSSTGVYRCLNSCCCGSYGCHTSTSGQATSRNTFAVLSVISARCPYCSDCASVKHENLQRKFAATSGKLCCGCPAGSPWVSAGSGPGRAHLQLAAAQPAQRAAWRAAPAPRHIACSIREMRCEIPLNIENVGVCCLLVHMAPHVITCRSDNDRIALTSTQLCSDCAGCMPADMLADLDAELSWCWVLPVLVLCSCCTPQLLLSCCHSHVCTLSPTACSSCDAVSRKTMSCCCCCSCRVARAAGCAVPGLLGPAAKPRAK